MQFVSICMCVAVDQGWCTGKMDVSYGKQLGLSFSHTWQRVQIKLHFELGFFMSFQCHFKIFNIQNDFIEFFSMAPIRILGVVL